MDAQTFQLKDPVNHLPTGTIALGGNARVGQALSANTSTLADADTLGELNYQWERQSGEAWSAIANANTNAYVLTSDDLGAKVRVKVSYLDGLKNPESLNSAATDTVGPSGYTLNGVAKFWKGSTVKLKDVSITAGGQTGTSDSTGAFSLGGMAQDSGAALFTLNANKIVTATKASEAGISLTDVLGALKVYLGKDLPADYKSNYNYIAADFDANGVVNLTDVLSLLKYYLGKTTNAAPTWTFVDAADVDGSGNIAGTTGSISKSATTPHAVDVDLSSVSTVELVGVLRGDVDGSWVQG
jgi:hypothetical protein